MDAVGGPCRADGVAFAVERRPFARGEGRDALQHGIDHVGAGGGKAIRVRQFVDLHDMLQHETLVGDGGGKGHHSLPRISTI
ncbi:hypothetical protein WR25_03034 [Diploscapter pachys]|uniref:Uncharacterized protein n=1 Tax=Diploscapter pachys TaxID=2018661 RepID=A0A2A2M418_9BILA|nr:hypothetical protein WR25_03034 [Diploscapter pachys]